jgi:hypothetical protein
MIHSAVRPFCSKPDLSPMWPVRVCRVGHPSEGERQMFKEERDKCSKNSPVIVVAAFWALGL